MISDLIQRNVRQEVVVVQPAYAPTSTPSCKWRLRACDRLTYCALGVLSLVVWGTCCASILYSPDRISEHRVMGYVDVATYNARTANPLFTRHSYWIQNTRCKNWLASTWSESQKRWFCDEYLDEGIVKTVVPGELRALVLVPLIFTVFCFLMACRPARQPSLHAFKATRV